MVWIVSGFSTLRADDFSEISCVQSSSYKDHLISSHRAPKDWMTRSAAVSLNQEWEKDRSKAWYVELQREGARWVEAGMARGDATCVDWGLRQLAWGFAQMQSDGSFTCKDPFHSASFLVESTARSLLLLRASSEEKALPPAARDLMPRLLICARWLASPVHEKTLVKQRIYTHRRFLLGAALAQTASLHDDEALRRRARDLVSDGLSLQRDDGAFPEKGGHDSSYHAVALIYLQRYLLQNPPGPWREQCDRAAQRGVRWLGSRIDETGRVDVAGNTRTGLQQETGRTGAIKQVNFPEVAQALILHAYRTHDDAAQQMAVKVLRQRAIISR